MEVNGSIFVSNNWDSFFFLPALSLFPPLFLKLELHNIVNHSLWRELCYLEIFACRAHLFRIFSFRCRETDASISALVGFVIDHVAFFKDSKSNFNVNVFYCAWKNPGESCWNANLWRACSPSELAGPGRDSSYYAIKNGEVTAKKVN